MVAPVVEAVSSNFGEAVSTYTVTKPTGTVDLDFLLAIKWLSDDTPNLAGPTGFTQIGSDFVNTTIGMICQVWQKFASSDPASYTVGCGTNDSCSCTILRISGHDPTTPLDVTLTTGFSTTGTLSHLAPSVSPAGTDSLLVCSVCRTAVTDATASYTWPGGMTEQSDITPPSFDFITTSVATEILTASGPTGTRTATHTDSRGYMGISLAIKSGVPTPPEEGPRNSNAMYRMGR